MGIQSGRFLIVEQGSNPLFHRICGGPPALGNATPGKPQSPEDDAGLKAEDDDAQGDATRKENESQGNMFQGERSQIFGKIILVEEYVAQRKEYWVLILDLGKACLFYHHV